MFVLEDGGGAYSNLMSESPRFRRLRSKLRLKFARQLSVSAQLPQRVKQDGGEVVVLRREAAFGQPSSKADEVRTYTQLCWMLLKPRGGR